MPIILGRDLKESEKVPEDLILHSLNESLYGSLLISQKSHHKSRLQFHLLEPQYRASYLRKTQQIKRLQSKPLHLQQMDTC
jgi:DNA repair photolyase